MQWRHIEILLRLVPQPRDCLETNHHILRSGLGGTTCPAMPVGPPGSGRANPPARPRERLSSIFTRRRSRAPSHEASLENNALHHGAPARRVRRRSRWSGGTDLAMIFSPQDPTVPLAPAGHKSGHSNQSSWSRRRVMTPSLPPSAVPPDPAQLTAELQEHTLKHRESAKSLRSLFTRSRSRATSGSFHSISRLFHGRRKSSSAQKGHGVPRVTPLPTAQCADASPQDSRHSNKTPPMNRLTELAAQLDRHALRYLPPAIPLEPIQSSLDERRGDSASFDAEKLSQLPSVRGGNSHQHSNTLVFPSLSQKTQRRDPVDGASRDNEATSSGAPAQTTTEHQTEETEESSSGWNERQGNSYNSEDELDEVLRSKVFRGKAKVFEVTEMIGMNQGKPVLERVQVGSSPARGSVAHMRPGSTVRGTQSNTSSNGPGMTDPDTVRRALEGEFHPHVLASTVEAWPGPYLHARPRAATNPLRKMRSIPSLSPAAELLAHRPPLRAHIDPSQIVEPRNRVISAVGPSRSALSVTQQQQGPSTWSFRPKSMYIGGGAGLGLTASPMAKESGSMGLPPPSAGLTRVHINGALTGWSPMLQAHGDHAKLMQEDADVSELSTSMTSRRFHDDGVAEDAERTDDESFTDVLQTIPSGPGSVTGVPSKI